MATTYKVLGQAAPADTENANLYTVPSATSTVVSELHVANTTSSDATFRIYVRIAGVAAVDGNAWAKDVEIKANSIFSAVAGITLGASDIITVRSNTGSALTFMAFGSELS
jgi:hypothetical protein